jgi:3',5'-cyclic-AMP phosphodiesterase
MKQIAFITDVHLDEPFPHDNNDIARNNFEAVLADLEKRNINEVIFGGDIGDPTAHNYFFERLQSFSVKLVLGNHDKFENVKLHLHYKSEQEELYYKSEDEDYKCLFLDTSADEMSKTQLDWLKNELPGNKELILFLHHPVLAIDTAVDKMYPLKNRDEVKSILLSCNQRVTIFCGHYHMNDEQAYKNITQYTTQSISFQLVKNEPGIEIDNNNFGYRIITIHKDAVATELIHFKR